MEARVAQEVNCLLSDGWDWRDACNEVCRRHEISFDRVRQAFYHEFGVDPSSVIPHSEGQ